MPIEREPLAKVPKNYVPPNSTPYKVKDRDTWVSIAARYCIDPWDLIETNFQTRSETEVNWYLHHYVGCSVPSADGRNWRFSSSAKPGIIYVPRMPPLYFVVSDMKLIPQDKDKSCWYACGQMLISWRQRRTHQSETAHPDPSLIDKWSKRYDSNLVINNNQIAEFARDLGLMMLPPITPSPAYIQDLLRHNGPLWVNGKSHITVIAGIRTAASGYEVLVFDPDRSDLPHGAWRDYNDQYRLTGNTGLDASEESPTSMLCVG